MVLKQAASAIALLLMSSIAIAQQPPDAVRVRGTIESKDHQTLNVKARGGYPESGHWTEGTEKSASSHSPLRVIEAN